MDVEKQIQSALLLMRRGRYVEALEKLQRVSPQHPQNQSLLADLLQRTGNNRQAESIALQGLKHSRDKSDVAARFHFVLGNVLREKGQLKQAAERYLASEKAVSADIELLCWIQLRLVPAVSEPNGNEAATSRVADLKRTLARSGEARPFAAFHLWIVEGECTRGNIAEAKRHFAIAETLLKQVDDAWLQGY